MNQEREAFLGKLEGQEMRTPPEETNRFLAEAGLAATRIDPASMKALEEIFSTPKQVKKNDTGEENAKPAAAPEYRRRLDVHSNPEFRHADSEITMTGLKSAPETNFSVAGSTESSRDDLILQQLKIQTAMIMDMQSRIEYLANKVHSLAESAPGDRALPPQYQHPNHQEMYHPMHPPMYQMVHPPTQQFREPHSTDGMIPELRDVPVPNEPPPPPFRPPRNAFGTLCDSFANLATYIRDSRTVQVMRAFATLHRRHVRMNGALMFKVVLMVAIFSAKMMSRPATPGEFWTATMKFNLVMGMVFVGFLIQSGYISFLYRFFITHRLFDRIYGGENVDIDRLVWNNHATRENNANGNNLRNMIPRNHMLGGNIPAPRNGINVLVDIAILIGSFMLSILPMWKPEGQPQERQARMALAQAIPQADMNAVAPPPDLDQHAADDDDDDDDDVAPQAHQD
jgi:hypothetical protein